MNAFRGKGRHRGFCAIDRCCGGNASCRVYPDRRRLGPLNNTWKTVRALLPLPFIFLSGLYFAQASQSIMIPESVAREALDGRKGAFVLIQCSSGQISDFNPKTSMERLPPCSTFKIWNALFGIEGGLVSDVEEAFYKWDGEERSIAAWNQNLTLRAAFQASCVPAFQGLARRIGEDRMNQWIKKIGYGDENTSAGIDIFWLPAVDRKTILISPREQADLLCRLSNGKLPFSADSIAKLKELMETRKTDKGILYGKTGSRSSGVGKYDMGWFVGLVESGDETYAFACNLQAENTSGADARRATELILESQNLL